MTNLQQVCRTSLYNNTHPYTSVRPEENITIIDFYSVRSACCFPFRILSRFTHSFEMAPAHLMDKETSRTGESVEDRQDQGLYTSSPGLFKSHTPLSIRVGAIYRYCRNMNNVMNEKFHSGFLSFIQALFIMCVMMMGRSWDVYLGINEPISANWFSDCWFLVMAIRVSMVTVWWIWMEWKYVSNSPCCCYFNQTWYILEISTVTSNIGTGENRKIIRHKIHCRRKPIVSWIDRNMP